MESLKIIAFTHKSIDLNLLGRFFIDENHRQNRLQALKKRAGLDELFYVATCNRIEFVFSVSEKLTKSFLRNFFSAFDPKWTSVDISWAIEHVLSFEGEAALEHLFHVAASLDSLVIGEREIIAQVRKAYSNCKEYSLTGDLLRLVMQSTVKAAKEVFTNTQIADSPISVVSLAYRQLRKLNVPLSSRFLIVGAGETNTSMSKYLLKHGFKNFTIFNRTFSKAEKLATELQGTALSLSELAKYKDGFDVLISCTGSSEPIITNEIYETLLQGDIHKKVLIDLAIPGDIAANISANCKVELIAMESLRSIAADNLRQRGKELVQAEKIVAENIEAFKQNLKARKIELAMQEVPRQIKEIRAMAMNNVFAKEVSQMDDFSREVLDKVLSYMEKKCIKVPMVLAKDILIKN